MISLIVYRYEIFPKRKIEIENIRNDLKWINISNTMNNRNDFFFKVRLHTRTQEQNKEIDRFQIPLLHTVLCILSYVFFGMQFDSAQTTNSK